MADKPAAGLPAQPYGKGTAFCAKWQCCVLKIKQYLKKMLLTLCLSAAY